MDEVGEVRAKTVGGGLEVEEVEPTVVEVAVVPAPAIGRRS